MQGHGAVRDGGAWYGRAVLGKVSLHFAVRVRYGKAGRGKARQGTVRPGAAGQCVARQGMAADLYLVVRVWSDLAWYGDVWRGKEAAMRGEAR